jgi:hypothetical protein
MTRPFAAIKIHPSTMTRPVASVETHPLTGKDAGPIPIVSPTTSVVEDLTTIVDPSKNPKQIDPSAFVRSPIHDQLQKQNNVKQRGWLQACLSTEMKPIFVHLAMATSSGFREGNLAESLWVALITPFA